MSQDQPSQYPQIYTSAQAEMNAVADTFMRILANRNTSLSVSTLYTCLYSIATHLDNQMRAEMVKQIMNLANTILMMDNEIEQVPQEVSPKNPLTLVQ